MTDTTIDPDAPAQDADTPELVTPEPDTTLAVYEPRPLSEAPATIPAQADLLALAQLANTFAGAKLVPLALQGKPADVLLILLTARDLGLPATVALRECHPIDGRVTVSPKLKLAIVRERRLGRVWPDQDNDLHEHTWYASRHDDPETTYRSTYTWEDAQRAGLVGRTCTATEHKLGANGKCGCKQNWRTYPGQMLQWRALGYLMDQAFGEVGTGLYGADELGAITDEEGRIIDVAEVGNLPGMETPAAPPPPPPPAPADPDALWDLQVRIRALPDEQRALMADRWKESSKLTHEVNGARLPIRPHQLPATSVASAESMLTGFEKLAQRGGWSPPEAHEAVTSQVAEVLVWALAPWVPTTPATQAPAAPKPDAGSTGTPDSTETQGATHSPEPPTGEFDRQTTARWLDSLDDLSVADLLTEYELDGAGTKVAKRRRVLDFLQALAQPATEA